LNIQHLIHPVTDNTVAVPPAVAPTIAPACIPQRLTRATAPLTFKPPSPSSSEDSDDDDGSPVPPPTPHAPFDMADTNAPLAPHLPGELRNFETFYNPKPGDQGNIPLLTHSDDVIEDELFAYPYK
jgi:hypothetical protein